MIRVELIVSCDVPGCPRSTKATAEFGGIVKWRVVSSAY